MTHNQNLILEKSFDFTSDIIDVAEIIKKKNYVIANQIMRSGTSIGANVTEAQNAQSRKDFASKMYIAFKEAAETSYWLRLAKRKDYINDETFNEAFDEITSIQKILSKITKSCKTN